MNNLLLEPGSPQGLPEEIDGVPIYPDWRNMVRFELIALDATLPKTEQVYAGLRQLFGEQLPGDNVDRAAERLLWFYRCGKEPGHGKGSKQPRAYDFRQDAGSIYAAFLQAYQIDLIATPYLHWWAFVALLENLPEETVMAKKMQLRLLDVSKIKNKNLRAEYAAAQRDIALDQPDAGESVENLSLKYKEKIAKRFAEAEAARTKNGPPHTEAAQGARSQP